MKWPSLREHYAAKVAHFTEYEREKLRVEEEYVEALRTLPEDSFNDAHQSELWRQREWRDVSIRALASRFDLHPRSLRSGDPVICIGGSTQATPGTIGVRVHTEWRSDPSAPSRLPDFYGYYSTAIYIDRYHNPPVARCVATGVLLPQSGRVVEMLKRRTREPAYERLCGASEDLVADLRIAYEAWLEKFERDCREAHERLRRGE